MYLFLVILLIGWIIYSFYRNQTKTLIIKPYGRFGNNVIQLRNAINLSLQYGITRIIHQKHNTLFKLPQRKLCTMSATKLRELNLQSQKLFLDTKQSKIITKILPDFDMELIDEPLITKLVREYYKKVFNFKYAPHDRDDLIIHIRSGDIFKDKNPHNGYTQPPYEYYRTIIMSKKWNNITIVSEDELNPVTYHCYVTNLISNFKQHDLNTDIETNSKCKYNRSWWRFFYSTDFITIVGIQKSILF